MPSSRSDVGSQSGGSMLEPAASTTASGWSASTSAADAVKPSSKATPSRRAAACW